MAADDVGVRLMPAPHDALTPGPLMARDLTTRLAALEAAVARMRHGTSDDAVHDVRVISRRLSAALDLWRPWLDPRDRRRGQRRLRRLRRRLRQVRDLEVALAELRSHLPHAEHATRQALERMTASLERHHERARASASRAIGDRRMRRIQRGLKRIAETISRRAPAARKIEPALGAQIDRQRARATLALAAGFETRTDAALHAARIAVKHWRYAIEAALPWRAEQAWRDTSMATIRELRSLQEALGRIQDLAVARELVERRVRRARERSHPEDAGGLEPLLIVLAHERDHALAEAYRFGTTRSDGTAGSDGT